MLLILLHLPLTMLLVGKALLLLLQTQPKLDLKQLNCQAELPDFITTKNKLTSHHGKLMYTLVDILSKLYHGLQEQLNLDLLA